MKTIRDLFLGRYPLWCVFWLMGLPIYAIHHISAGCSIAACSSQANDSYLPLVMISGIGTLLMAVPIWRSATNYVGKHFIAVSAKVYVGLTVLVAIPMSIAAIFGLAYHAATGHW